MKEFTKDELNGLLLEFLDYENYEIKFLRGPSEKNQTKAVEVLKNLDFEVFPHVITTSKNENTIYYRKKKK